MTINTNAINFRTKFSKHIQNDEQHKAFVAAFEKFINLDSETAIGILWRLTYDTSSKVLQEIGLNPETISPEMKTLLRNELRYQREHCHCNALQIEVPEEYLASYARLAKNTDAIITYVVYTHCITLLYLDESSITRTLFLLNSDKENQYFGGLRSLSFNTEEAEFLKPYHQDIHALLKVMYELRKSQGAYTSNSNPFKDLDTMIQKTGNDLPFTFGDDEPESVEKMPVDEVHDSSLPEKIPTEEPTEETIPEIPVFIKITAENVLKHKDVFSAFAITRDMSCLVELSKLGFDLNQVVAKEKAISDFIQSAEALSV